MAVNEPKHRRALKNGFGCWQQFSKFSNFFIIWLILMKFSRIFTHDISSSFYLDFGRTKWVISLGGINVFLSNSTHKFLHGTFVYLICHFLDLPLDNAQNISICWIHGQFGVSSWLSQARASRVLFFRSNEWTKSILKTLFVSMR